MVKSVSETIKNEKKKPQESAFLNIIIGTSAASLLGNILPGKGVIGADEGTIRIGQDF